MYINKWWRNITCGDTDDSMLLLDYLRAKGSKNFKLNEILKDAQIEQVLGVKHLYEINEIPCFFWLEVGNQAVHADFQIPINLVIDLSALLLQTLVEGAVTLEHLSQPMEFSIVAEKDELKLMIAELENAVKQPQLYYPDFLQEEFSEMKGGIIEIYTHLERYC